MSKPHSVVRNSEKFEKYLYTVPYIYHISSTGEPIDNVENELLILQQICDEELKLET